MKNFFSKRGSKSSIYLSLLNPSRKRIASVLLAGMFLPTNTLSLYAQNTDITLYLNNVTVERVLEEIESKSDYSFLYNNKIINVDKKISINVESGDIESILGQMFQGTDVSYSIVNKQIVLSKKSVSKRNFNIAQQNRTITGKVTDTAGEPIIGANVLVKGSSVGTITDIHGNFSIEVTNGDILQISYIGYTDSKVKIGKQKILNISLEEDKKALDEVVVVGYGKQSKALVTGAIAKVNMKQMEGTMTTNVSQALRGRVAGVQFLDNGRPGQNGSIIIRGRNSLSASNSPLIVLDGIVFNGAISDINPSDIQSMEVLKDASASAIYGSRASNGVILITSKQGNDGKPKVTFDGSFSIQNWSKKLDLLSPDRYIQKMLDWRAENGDSSDPSHLEEYLWPTEFENYQNGRTVNPWDVVSQDSYTQNYNLSVRGGVSNTKYFFSGAYTDEKGLIYNDNANRISFRANLDTKVSSWFSMGITAMYSRRTKPGSPASMHDAFYLSPWSSMNLENGDMNRFPFEDAAVKHPLWNCENTESESINNTLLANFYGIVDFGGFTPLLEGLTYRINYSPTYRVNNSNHFVPISNEQGMNEKGSASKSHSEVNSWVLENIINYNKTFFDNHTIDLTLLYGSDKSHSSSTSASSSSLLSNANGWNNLGLGETQIAGSNASVKTGISEMLRLNYRYKNRYLATFTIRRDGSSVFGKNNKFGNFPSGALAWIVSNENFLEDVNWLDMLKLRISYGRTGNQAISPYQSLDRSGTTKYVFGDGSLPYIGMYPSSMANSSLTWETTTSANIALDFSIFNKLSGTLEFYNAKTEDLLIRRSIPIMNGFGNVMSNLGEVNNKGIELSLNSTNIKTKDFEWNTGLSLSYNKNKIISLYGNDLNQDGIEDDDLANRWFINNPIGVMYDYVIDGIYQEGDDMPKSYLPGMYRYKDVNNDGKITPEDRTILGKTESPFRWGLSNYFRYQNFELDFFINAMHGWVGANTLDHTLINTMVGRVNFVDQGWWTPENKSTTRPKLINGNPYLVKQTSSRSFVRLQDVKLSYSLPTSVLSKLSIERLKFFISGRNLFTITDFVGFDPESGAGKDSFPTPRTFSLGLSATF